MRAFLVSFLLGASMVGSGGLTPTAIAADAGVAFVETTPISVVFLSSSDKPTALVAVTNNGDSPADLKFSPLLSADGKSPTSETVTITPTPAHIEGNQTSYLTLTFSRTGEGDLSGQIVMSATGLDPAARPLRLSTDDSLIKVSRGTLKFVVPFPAGPGGVLVLAVILAAILLVLRLAIGRFDLRKPMGKREWKFSESWASTFTVVGAIFGTVLAAGVLPDDPDLLNKAQYAGINVLFASLVVLAGFVFDALRRPAGRV